jgi:hypothetical protein
VRDVNALARRIGDAVYQNSPNSLCFTCLAAQQGLSEHDARSAALVLIARAGLGLVRQPCYACGRTDDMMIVRQAA